MTLSRLLVRSSILPAALALFAAVGSSGEKSLLHCFYFTPIAEATDSDWEAFYAATDQLPSKIDGLDRVWVGKLTERAPVAQQVKLGRTFGACMEFTDQAALKAYSTHPAHDTWLEAYVRVRVAGTTTFDILGR